MRSPTTRSNKSTRRLLLVACVIAAVGTLAVSDMIFGNQLCSSLLGGRPNDTRLGYSYYQDGGIRIGKWQIVRPPVESAFLGYSITVLDDGTHLPILESRDYYRDGTLRRDVKAFDSAGAEVPLHPIDADPSWLKQARPHARVVVFDYAPDGVLAGQFTWRNGVVQK